MWVDLNADLGEGLDRSDDLALLAQVTSVNIACGGHAGDAVLMRTTLEAARAHGVAAGAHPSFNDRDGFGRREMRLPERDVEALVLAQVEELATVAAQVGVRLRHVKPHGALYNMAARDIALASAVARAVKTFDPGLMLVGLAASASIEASRQVGLRAVEEGFADRAYRADGTLVPRTAANAVLHDPETVTTQALRMVKEGVVVAVTGETIRLRVDTICVHGDTQAASALAVALRTALLQAGVAVRAI